MASACLSRVSVVVLTFNRHGELLQTLHRLTALPGCHPIIVVDNASTDGTMDVVRTTFPTVAAVRCARNLGAAGRNLGVERVLTPYVAFSDDDTAWEPGALERAEDVLDAAPSVAVLNAKILVGQERRTDPGCGIMARSPLPGPPGIGPCLTGFMAGACVMRTAVFRQAGGYWPALFIGGEETLLALDILELGWRIVYCPAVVTRHFPSLSRDEPLRRRLLARNAVWTAWMRFPWRDALRATRGELALAHRTGRASQLLSDALAGAPKVLLRRKPVSLRVWRLWRATNQ